MDSFEENKKYIKGDASGEVVQEVKRRSVTLTDTVDERIMKLRGLFISKGLDLNYTTALNFLAHYGDEKLQEEGWDTLAFQILKKHFESDELKERSIVDEWADIQDYRKWKQQKT